MNKIKVFLSLLLVIVSFSWAGQSALAAGPTPYETQRLIAALADGSLTLEQLSKLEQAAIHDYIKTTPAQVNFEINTETPLRMLPFYHHPTLDNCNTVVAKSTLDLPLPLTSRRVTLGSQSQRVNWCYGNGRISTIGRANPIIDTALFFKKGEVNSWESGGEGQLTYRKTSEVEIQFCLPVSIGVPRFPIIKAELPCLSKQFPPMWIEVRGDGDYSSNANESLQTVGECWLTTRIGRKLRKLIDREASVNECLEVIWFQFRSLPKRDDGYAHILFTQGPQGRENLEIAINNAQELWIKKAGSAWQRLQSPSL